MITKSLVSVIMPAYNAEKYIGESIESVLYQTYPYWELLVIDDGSTDSTKEVVRQFLDLDSRIKYYYQDNGKQGKARNLGIEKSKGEYLAFLDSDDLWFPNKLEIQIHEIIEKDVDLIFCDSYIYSDGTSILKRDKVGVKDGVYSGEEAIKLFIECNRIPILTVLAKKSAVQKVGGFIESVEVQYGEDYHLWLKLLLSGSTFFSSSEALAKYRIHSNSVTINDSSFELKILAIYYDLIIINSKYSQVFNKKIRHILKEYYATHLFSKNELATIVRLNSTYLFWRKFDFIFLFLNWLFPTKITKRLLILLLN